MGMSAVSGSVNTQIPDYYQKMASGKKIDAAPEETTAAANGGMAETSVVQTKVETQNSKEQKQDNPTAQASVSKTPDSEMSEYLKKIAEDSMKRLTNQDGAKEAKSMTSDQGRELENFRVENQAEIVSNMASQLS